MSQSQTLPLLSSFADLADPRVENTRRHELLDIIGLTVCAVIAGADDWVHVEYFGKAKADWLETFLALPNGIPSHDTIGRVFASLDSEQFAARFSAWVAGFSERLGLKHVAIDGKCLRRSGDPAKGKKAIHAVSAWACDARLTLGITEVDQKSNEITAIPKLLEILELEGALVTIDAMGCQKEIASGIRTAGADYLLQVKGNQPRLQEDIAAVFEAFVDSDMTSACHDRHETTEEGHGREEERSVWVFAQVDSIRDRELWEDLKSLVVVWRGRKVGERQSGELRGCERNGERAGVRVNSLVAVEERNRRSVWHRGLSKATSQPVSPPPRLCTSLSPAPAPLSPVGPLRRAAVHRTSHYGRSRTTSRSPSPSPAHAPATAASHGFASAR